jgi:hypothetical protein
MVGNVPDLLTVLGLPACSPMHAALAGHVGGGTTNVRCVTPEPFTVGFLGLVGEVLRGEPQRD